MTKGLSFFDRLVVFLFGLLLIVAGFVPVALYWDSPYVSDWINQFNRASISEVPYYGWYNTALIIAAIVLFFVGLWLILANIRSRAFSNREIAAADPAHGDTVINVQRVAEAACTAITQSPSVSRASCKVAMVGKRPTATFTVIANPSYDLGEAISAIESANEDFRVANHTMEIDTVWKLHLDRIAA